MRIAGIIVKSVALLCLVLSVGGCDFFRKLANRPTSEDIAAKRAEIERIETEKAAAARLARIADSLAAREIAVYDSLASEKKIMSPVSRIVWTSETQTDSLCCRFYVMVGAFGVYANAEKQAGRVREAGYDATLVEFANGLIAVAVGGSESSLEIKDTFDALKSTTFCPAEAWILQSR